MSTGCLNAIVLPIARPVPATRGAALSAALPTSLPIAPIVGTCPGFRNALAAAADAPFLIALDIGADNLPSIKKSTTPTPNAIAPIAFRSFCDINGIPRLSGYVVIGSKLIDQVL